MTIRHGIALLSAFCLSLTLSPSTFAGFSVAGTDLHDGNGEVFVMRGVNHPHAWYNYRTHAFKDISAAGANTVRVVLSDGQQFTKSTPTDVGNVIKTCKNNQLICVLEVHDITGSGEKAEAGTMSGTIAYWLELAEVLTGEEDYVIINIANEPFGNGVPESTWVNEHITAIQSLRNAGLTHTLMVDAANWGQDWQEIMLNNAQLVAAADTLNNTMFSVHMYEVYGNRDKIENYVSTFLTRHQLPLIVGEFGGEHNGQNVDEDAILAVAQEYNIGYLGWSWSGNTSFGTEQLDMTVNFDPAILTPWGERLLNGVNGIVSTSKKASVYAGQVPKVPLSCNWYGSILPICEFIDEGHGWENEQNCVGIDTCRDQDGDGGVIEDPMPTPSPTPTITPTATPTPSTTPSPTPTSTPTPPNSGGVECTYSRVNAWNSGFQGQITISNNSTVAVSGWEVHWLFLDSSTVSSVWNAQFTQGNPNTASHLGWNQNIAAGASVSFGFTGSGAGENVAFSGPSCE